MATVAVLHVEDDPIQQKLLAHHLEAISDLEFTITVATGEPAALDAFRVGHFELVILDYLLEQGNGLHLVRSIRQLNPIVPIIAVSGIATEAVAAKLAQAGADDFFNKRELTSSQLALSVRGNLRRAEGIRQRMATALSGEETLDAKLAALCKAYAASVGPELFAQFDVFESAARRAKLTAEQVESLFSRVIAGLESTGQSRNVPARLFRPLILETVMRLFDDVTPG